MKRNKDLILATVWMKLKNIMLRSKRLYTKGHILYDCIYMKCPELENPESEHRWVVVGG